jgi:hypothetical protein
LASALACLCGSWKDENLSNGNTHLYGSWKDEKFWIASISANIARVELKLCSKHL